MSRRAVRNTVTAFARPVARRFALLFALAFARLFTLPDALARAPDDAEERNSRPSLLRLRPGYDPDDPMPLPDAPAPPSLPDLTHRGLAASFSVAFASIDPAVVDASTAKEPERVGATIETVETELAVANRRWYIGMGNSFAQGSTLAGEQGTQRVGNPEIWGRALWASQAGLAYGGGISFVLPILSFAREPGSAASAMRAVQPWEYPRFAGRTLAIRPFFDVRIVDNSILLQLRQGLDVMRALDRSALPNITLAGRTTLYMGYRPSIPLGIGLEFSEVYLLQAAGIADDERTVLTVSPSIRWMFSLLQPSVSGLWPIGRPMLGDARNYWAVRLSVGLVVDTTM